MTNSLVTSTLTDRYQTTIPEAVRELLGLSKRDQIEYRLQDGQVIISRSAPEQDPALAPFLLFLQNDMQAHPERLQPLTLDLHNHLQALTGDVDVNLDAPLSVDDE